VDADATRTFEQSRGRLHAVAYRMLGSLSDADDAVQEAWLRLSRSERAGIDNLPAWLTTVTGRICLDMLRSRTTRREEPLDAHLPDPVITADDPEQDAILTDAVGLAMLIVLDTLTPAERLVFVLHDMFAMPFAELAPIMGRSPAAAKQLASRARRRVREAAPHRSGSPVTDRSRQRGLVEVFRRAPRTGDVAALMTVLDPHVVARSDSGRGRPATVTTGAEAVADQASTFARLAASTRSVLVNGVPGLLAFSAEGPFAVMSFVTAGDRITRIDILTDRTGLASLVPPMAV
jgi:RNA polymerase sigma factor (sigma-70 family)